MHDMRTIRESPEAFDAALARRRLPPRASGILAADAERRTALAALQDTQARRNTLARTIGQRKRAGADTAEMETEAAALRTAMESLQATAAEGEHAVRAVLEALPNMLAADVPDGADETANVELSRSGEPLALPFLAREHFELGEALGQMDFAAAARIAGSRFTVLRGPLARLERALGQFMLDLHVAEHGYQEVSPPTLVNDSAVYGTGQLPKFADDLFRTTDGRWLIPTAEVSLTNLLAGEIMPAAALPLRFTALTECYRSEAGAAGRDTRGMMRQHQFRKVELVSIVHPDRSAEEHERMTAAAETVLTRLGLTWRRMLLCAGDTGFSAARTYDLEVWLPGQNAWREISSCSNTRDFQARRMNARFRDDGGALRFVHTLNGSGVAVGRALIAVMETYQQPDGSIAIPPALQGAMGGQTVVTTAKQVSA